MAFSRSIYCDYCRRRTLHRRRIFGGSAAIFRLALNLFLVVVTLGFWIPVWLFRTLSRPDRGFYCSVCGEDR